MKIPPKSLVGNRIWIILRGIDDRVFLSISIKKVEKIIEGYYEGDYLVSVDLLKSFRLVSQYSDANKFSTTRTTSHSLGISIISEDVVNDWLMVIVQNVNIKLTNPDTKLITKLDSTILPKHGQSLAESAVRIVVSNVNLDDVWAGSPRRKEEAFSNFAEEIIRTSVSPESANEVSNFLVNIDPIGSLSKYNTNQDNIHENMTGKLPQIDTGFSELEPEKIFAREYLLSDDTFTDRESALRKTEHAEKKHQTMLKEIAEFLLSKKIIPYESSSIDLMYKIDKQLIICEIKSATSDNILTQSSNGAFQLACYIEEVIKYYDDPIPQLILERIGDEEIESYVEKILGNMNIPVLYYDPKKSWPHKIAELLL